MKIELLKNIFEKKSCRVERIQKGKFAFGAALAFLLAVFFLLLTYPGILSPDSITSWTEASRNQFTTLKPPFLALLQCIFLVPLPIEEAAAAFSLIQGFLFWFSIFFLLTCVIEGFIPFAAACFLFLFIVPLWSYTTVHWTDVWVLIFLLLAVSFFEMLRQSEYSNRGYLLAGLLFAFLAVSTRHNAVSTLPIIVLPLIQWLRHRWDGGMIRNVGLAGLAIPALFFGTKLFLLLPQVQVTPSLAPFGLINSYFGTIAHSSENVKARLLADETSAFDEHFGPGSLVAAVEAYEPRFNGRLVWGQNSILRFNNLRGFETVLQNNDFIVTSFLRIVRASPEGFIKHKVAYLRGQFGVGSVRMVLGTGVHANKLGLQAKPVMQGLRKELVSFGREKSRLFLFQHWFSFAVGFAALLANCFVVRSPVVGRLFTGAILYAIPYIIFETGWEWRYLMPSYVMNFLAAVIVGTRLAKNFSLRRS